MNAGGMLQECRTGLFRGGLLDESRCSLRGNHRIIIPPLLTFFPLQHTHTVYTDPYTLSTGTVCTVRPSREGGLNVTPS